MANTATIATPAFTKAPAQKSVATTGPRQQTVSLIDKLAALISTQYRGL